MTHPGKNPLMAAASGMDVEIWGDFEVHLDRILGRGGTSTVYAARQISLDRPCVVKVLDIGERDPDLRQEALRRFRAEAVHLARLQDPRIVQVYQAGEHKGRFWIAMERIEGETLEQKLERGVCFEEAEVRRIVREVALVLQAALKSHRMVHRDIKPGNLFLTPAGEVRVSDFGLARILRSGQERITRTGMVVGTPAYIAPELVRGGPADHRADIYALGCLAYELVAQLPPFDGETAVDLLFKHVHETPIPPRDLQPALSAEFNDVILRCLEKDPGDRYQDYDEFLQALEARPESPGERRPRPKLPVFAGLSLLVLCGVAVAWSAFRRSPRPVPGNPRPVTIPEQPRRPAPAPAPDPYEEARALFEQGQAEEAVRKAERSGDPRALLLIAEIEYKRGDYRRALEAARSFPNRSPEARRWEGLASLRLGLPDAASRLLSPSPERALALAAAGRYDEAARDRPGDGLRTVLEIILKTPTRIRSIEELKALKESLGRLRDTGGKGIIASVARAFASAAYTALGNGTEARRHSREAKALYPGIRIPRPSLSLDGRALRGEAEKAIERDEFGPANRLAGLVEELGATRLQAELEPLRREIEAQELLQAGNRLRVLREYAGTRAHRKIVGRLQAEFQDAGFTDLLALRDRWKLKAASPAAARVEFDGRGLHLSSVPAAYVEFDGVNPAGYRLRLGTELREGGWASVVIHRRSDEDLDLLVLSRGTVRLVRWRDGKETELARVPHRGPTTTVEVWPADGVLLVRIDGRYLGFLEVPSPTRLRVGIRSGALILMSAEAVD